MHGSRVATPKSNTETRCFQENLEYELIPDFKKNSSVETRYAGKNCKWAFNTEKEIDKLTNVNPFTCSHSKLIFFLVFSYKILLNVEIFSLCVWMRRGDRRWGFFNFSYACCQPLLLVFLLCLLFGEQRKNTTKSNLSHLKENPMPCPGCVVKKNINSVSPITVKFLWP